jgi:hypothetical protein
LNKVILKDIALFILILAILSPLIYKMGCWMFTYEPEPAQKASSFGPLFRYRIGETLPAGNASPCPVVPTSLCEGNFYLVPISSANTPIEL